MTELAAWRGMNWAEASTALVQLTSQRSRQVKAVVVVDHHLNDSAIVRLVLDWLRFHRVSATLEPTGNPPVGEVDVVEELAQFGRKISRGDLVVAIGGGSTLDEAKLATLLDSGEANRHVLGRQGRCGFSALIAGELRRCPLIAIPTTLGTGAEASTLVVLNLGGARKLVIGRALLPQIIVTEPLATAGLPPWLVREGALEILARLVNPYVSDPSEATTLSDEIVHVMVARFLRLASKVCQTGTPNEIQRREIALISRASHGSCLARPETLLPLVWILSNELAAQGGFRKMEVTPAVWVEVWRRAAQGDVRFGSERRLRKIWALITETNSEDLPDAPAAGLEHLIMSWKGGKQVDLSSIDQQAAIDRIVRHWGAGFPFLQGLERKDLEQLVIEICRISVNPSASPKSNNERKEVKI